MKIHTSLILSVICMVLCSCNVSSNGAIDGLWYMTQMDSISSGVSVPMRQEKITWGFQEELVQVVDYDTENWRHIIMLHFTSSDDELTLSDPFIYNRLDGDVYFSADSLYLLTPYGINSIPDHFSIEHLSMRKMRISDGVLRLHFEKY